MDGYKQTTFYASYSPHTSTAKYADATDHAIPCPPSAIRCEPAETCPCARPHAETQTHRLAYPHKRPALNQEWIQRSWGFLKNATNQLSAVFIQLFGIIVLQITILVHFPRDESSFHQRYRNISRPS